VFVLHQINWFWVLIIVVPVSVAAGAVAVSAVVFILLQVARLVERSRSDPW
jgi:hypothetical protein